jgi:hypothetical protein
MVLATDWTQHGEATCSRQQRWRLGVLVDPLTLPSGSLCSSQQAAKCQFFSLNSMFQSAVVASFSSL